MQNWDIRWIPRDLLDDTTALACWTDSSPSSIATPVSFPRSVLAVEWRVIVSQISIQRVTRSGDYATIIWSCLTRGYRFHRGLRKTPPKSKIFGLAHCFVLADMCLYSLNSSNVPLFALFFFHFCSLPLIRPPQRPPSHQLILSKISPPVIVCPVKLGFTIPAACKSWTRLKMRPSQPLAAV